MAHFYGRLQGSRGEATRCGTKSSGIAATVRSWDGNLTTILLHNGTCDEARIKLSPEDISARMMGRFNSPAVMAALRTDDPAIHAAIDTIQDAFAQLNETAKAIQAAN